MSSYRIVEPHPTTTSSTTRAFHTSRGGAGNVTHLKDTTKPTQKSNPSTGAARTTTNTSSDQPSRQRRYFSSGRGGAGNLLRCSSEHPTIFSFDEELEYQMQHEKNAAPIFHVGRGGAGNTAAPEISRKWSNSTTHSTSSVSSNTSSESRWEKLFGLR